MKSKYYFNEEIVNGDGLRDVGNILRYVNLTTGLMVDKFSYEGEQVIRVFRIKEEVHPGWYKVVSLQSDLKGSEVREYYDFNIKPYGKYKKGMLVSCL